MRCGSFVHSICRRLCQLILMGGVMMAAMPTQADVLISPLRVHLDDDQRTATIIMRNPSDGPRTYRLEWLEQSVSETGAYRKYKEGETVKHSPASPFLRLSPRQITVQPGINQKVRVQFRSKPDMAPGEYRSHLLFKVVSELSSPTSTTEIGAGEGVTLVLNMQMSFAIPVVVRHGVNEAPEVKIADIETVPATEPGQTAQLSVLLKRSGVAGSYGRVVVEMQRDEASPVERIGVADNVSVFADVSQRRLHISLRDTHIPSGAWLRVVYEGQSEYAGMVWDEQVFQAR